MTKKIQIFIGRGGVGKTTVSAQKAIDAVKKGQNSFIMTVDPSKRLASTLNIDINNPDTQTIKFSENSLDVWLTSPKQIIEQFVKENFSDRQLIKDLKNNSLYKQLVSHLAGTQEFTSLVKLVNAYESNQYEQVFLDTAPFQNSIQFFENPKELKVLFGNKVMKLFLNEKSSRFSFITDPGRKLALKGLEILTGEAFVKELLLFFKGMKGIQSNVLEKMDTIEHLLKNQNVEFNYVTSFNNNDFFTAESIMDYLSKNNYNLKKIILNHWPKIVTKKMKHPYDQYLNARIDLFNKKLDYFISCHPDIEIEKYFFSDKPLTK